MTKKLSVKSEAAIAAYDEMLKAANRYVSPEKCFPTTYNWINELKPKLESRSYVAEGAYETPNGVKRVTVALDGLKSMFYNIADVLSDTRIRHSVTPADPMLLLNLVLQVLDKGQQVGVERAMKLYAIIAGETLPLQCYLTVSFRVDIIEKGKNTCNDYDRRDGNTFWPAGNLETTVHSLLKLSDSATAKFLKEQVKLGVISELNGGYAPTQVLKGLAKMRDLKATKDCIDINFDDDCPLTEEQKTAVKRILETPLALLLAPGGSGKTFSVSWLIHYLINHKYSVAVLAPTGVAVNTIREDIGGNVSYKFIECLSSSDVRTIDWWLCSPTAPKEVDIVFVDEASMMTYDHLLALPNCKHLIFIGDLMQLPPVGMGTPLSDLQKFVRPQTLSTNMRANGAPVLADRLDTVRLKHELIYREDTDNNIYLYSDMWKYKQMVSRTKDAATNDILAKDIFAYCKKSEYMYNKLCIAHDYSATVTCLRKDVIAAINRWFTLKNIGTSEDELKMLAAEIQYRCLVTKELAVRYCGDPDLPLEFREDDEVVWISSREDVSVKGKRESVYSGFVGKIAESNDLDYKVRFPRCELYVAKDECTMRKTPIYLTKARNIHKLQSLGTPIVMYVVSRVIHRKDENGAWKSYCDLSEAYTSVSRSRKKYIVANPYGIKVAKRITADKYSIRLEEAPEVDSAVNQLVANNYFDSVDDVVVDENE